MEAIILAGGLGTRLRSEVADLPKCMAPVAGKPFLHHIITYCLEQGITRFIFALGYMHEVIETYLVETHPELNYQVSIEEEPLGTGGGIQLACKKATEENVLILNGDTLFKVDIKALLNLHVKKNADCTLSLKPMQDFERYGVVELNEDGTISSFKEKQYYKNGLINGGTYALNVKRFLAKALPEKYSFEKNYLEGFYKKRKMFGFIQDGYFIDIGIPEDFKKANKDLAMNWDSIDKTWTLFLDRDGVINHEKHKDYIHTWDEFTFYEGVQDAVKIFTEKFGRIIIVTNQKGVGKGLTKLKDLELIHKNMRAAFEKAGGKIDAVYFSPALEEDHPDRKPNPGMGLKAKKDFPQIDFRKAVMVGNTLSDMEFGRNAGIAKNIFLPTTRPEVDINDSRIDAVYPSLIAFALAL